MVSRYNRRPSVTRRPNVKSDNEDWILERITSLEDTLSGVEDNLNALIEAYNGTRDYLDELEERLVNAMKKMIDRWNKGVYKKLILLPDLYFTCNHSLDNNTNDKCWQKCNRQKLEAHRSCAFWPICR